MGETGFVHQPQLLFEACYFQILSLLSSGSVKGKILVPVQRVMGEGLRVRGEGIRVVQVLVPPLLWVRERADSA